MSSEASLPSVFSHWSTLMEGLQASPKDFYSSVEVAVRKRELADCALSRVDWKEGGLFSAGREYLRVMRGRLIFDICAAPFGNGFFVSWWLARAESSFGALALLLLIVGLFVAMIISVRIFGFLAGWLFFLVVVPALFWLFVKFMNGSRQEGWDDALVAMPLVGSWYERIFRPETYYKIDTALMFQESIRNSVLEVIDGLTSAKGVRALTELERKPILREFPKR